MKLGEIRIFILKFSLEIPQDNWKLVFEEAHFLLFIAGCSENKGLAVAPENEITGAGGKVWRW